MKNESTNEVTNQFNVDSKKDKSIIVTLKCNRYGGHDFDFKDYKRTCFYQGTIDLDIAKPQELRALIITLKEMNVPKHSIRNSYTEMRGNGASRRAEVIPIWEIVGGEGNIPKELRGIKYRPNNYMTTNEVKDILTICPDYEKWVKNKRKFEMIKGIMKG